MSFSARCALCLWLFLLVACSSKQQGAPPRYAVLRFENLSGDSTLEWTARGTSEILSSSLSGALDGPVVSVDALARYSAAIGPHPPRAPGVSSARSAAIAAGANRLITGYIERAPGGIRITGTEEDLLTHKIVRTETASAASAFEAINGLAHRFAANAHAAPTGNAEAFRLYATALEDRPAEAKPVLQQATQLDPHFGRAWAALERTMVASGDRAGAQAVLEQTRDEHFTPIDRALLDSEDAALRGDHAAALAALRRQHELQPADIDLTRTLAQAETIAGNFREAAAAWKQLTAASPTNIDAWNQLGYTLGWAGDYDGAIAALRQYASLRPADANPLDSQGDVQFGFHKYAEAAASYSAAQAKSAEFLNGGDFYKAAWAKYYAGDKNGADALFEQFRGVRSKAGDTSLVLLQADWLYRTGRKQKAVALLRGEHAPALAAAVASELTVWDLLAGDRAAAAKDSAGLGSTGLTTAQFLVRFAALPSASATEWSSRAEHMLTAPQLTQLRSTALGYALMLDGKKRDALPVWEKLAAESSATDFFVQGILDHLKGQPVRHAVVPDPVSFNEFSALPDSL